MTRRARALGPDPADGARWLVDGPITLTVPGTAPSKGNSYRIGTRRDGTATLVKGRRHAGSDDVATFEARVLRAMIEARVRPFVGPVAVDVWVFAADLGRDVPGLEKALLDALQSFRRVGRRKVPNVGGAGCYADDRQVYRFGVDLAGIDPTAPRLELRVEPWLPGERPW